MMGFKSVKIKTLSCSGTHDASCYMRLIIRNRDHNQRKTIGKGFRNGIVTAMANDSIQIRQKIQLRNLIIDHKVLRPTVKKLRIRNQYNGQIFIFKGIYYFLEARFFMIMIESGCDAYQYLFVGAAFQSVPIKFTGDAAFHKNWSGELIILRKIHFTKEIF